MSTSIGKLTVFFEEPFWVGVFERIENGKVCVEHPTVRTADQHDVLSENK